MAPQNPGKKQPSRDQRKTNSTFSADPEDQSTSLNVMAKRKPHVGYIYYFHSIH